MKTGVAYFHTRDVRHVERDLEDMAEHGCNFVVHCYSETDLSFYNRSMQEIIRLTREFEMEVYLDPWGVGGIFGGETFSRFVAEKIEARQVNSKGELLPAACPNHPMFRAYMKHWTKRAAELGADICFWDEPHFHFNLLDQASWDKWACRCETCRNLFRETYGADMPQELTEEVMLFRQKSALQFLEEMCDEAKRLGMRNCICVLPDETGRMSKAAGTSEWENIARIPSVDIFGTDPYWILFNSPMEEFVRRYSLRVKELCDQYGKEPQVWVLAFIIPEGREEEVGEAVEVIYETGVRNIAAWAYRGSHLIDISCKNPEKVWDILGKAYKKVQKWDRKK